MEAAEAEEFEQQHDEALLAAVEGPENPPVDPVAVIPDEEAIEEDPVEDPYEFPVERAEEEPEDHDAIWRDIEMHPLPVPTVFSPPPVLWSPLPSEDEHEELPAESYETEAAIPSDPDSPPPPAPPGVPTTYHDWMVRSLTTEIAVSEGRIDELRRQLAAERDARQARRDGMWYGPPRTLRREITRIEMRARVRIRALPASSEGYIRREEAEVIWTEAMARVRDLTRPDE